MDIQNLIKNDMVDFTGIPSSCFLLGLISAFENRFQAMADKSMNDISWKQFFAIICINMCKEPPTINKLSEVLGSSHQNVKQILLKLEKKGFIKFVTDSNDKRKQRLILTKECMDFCEKNSSNSFEVINIMFRNVSEKDLKTTINTIMKIENNMKEIG